MGELSWGRGATRPTKISADPGDNKTATIAVPVLGSTRVEIESEWKLAVQKGADLIEWRVDAVRGNADLEVGRRLQNEYGIPVLVTVRTLAEGGHFDLREDSREQYDRLVLEAAGWAEAVDIEYAYPAAVELAREARTLGSAVVFSHHVLDAEVAPVLIRKQLRKQLSDMDENGADVAKIAWLVSRAAQVEVIEEAQLWALKKLNIPVVVIAMGDAGVATRVGNVARRNAFTFAVAGKSSAPGQVSIATVRASLAGE